LGVDYGRTNADPQPYPQVVFYGHMACLLNEGSGSDGDIFPHMFRQLGLGPLIGTRTWGGVVGINDHGPMIDGGQIFVPEAGSPEGHSPEPEARVRRRVPGPSLQDPPARVASVRSAAMRLSSSAD
jgi:hypothetical protein